MPHLNIHPAHDDDPLPGAVRKKRLGPWTSTGLKLTVTVGVIVALAAVVGWRDIGLALAATDMRLVGLAWILALAARCVSTGQLTLILRWAGLPVRGLHVLAANSLSALYGLVLPGDLAMIATKWAYLAEATGKRSSVFNAIVYNRIMAMLPWLVAGLGITSVAGLSDGWVLPAVAAGLLAATLALLVVVYRSPWAAPLDRLALAVSRRLLPRFVHRRVEYLFESLPVIRRFPWRNHFRIFAVGTWATVLSLAGFAVMARAIGVDVSLLVLLWVLCVLILLRQLPISFQGIGVREATLVVLLGRFGVPSETSFALGLLCLTNLLVFAALGLIFQVLLTANLMHPGRPTPEEKSLAPKGPAGKTQAGYRKAS